MVKHFDFFKKPTLPVVDVKKATSSEYTTHVSNKKRCPLSTSSFHIVDRPFKADLKVYFTKKEVEADILVYVSNYPFRAKGREEVWCYTDKEFNAETKIFPVEKPFMADLKVHIVDHEHRARWIKKRKVKPRQRQFN